MIEYFGPRPTKEEWAEWCEKNRDLWERGRIWQEEYKKDPYKTLTKMIKRMDKDA